MQTFVNEFEIKIKKVKQKDRMELQNLIVIFINQNLMIF